MILNPGYDAVYIDLNRKVATKDARLLLKELQSSISKTEPWQCAKTNPLMGTSKQLMEMLGAFVADLLRAERLSAQAWAFRSVRPETFSGGHADRQAFGAIVAAMVDVGLLRQVAGCSLSEWHGFHNNRVCYNEKVDGFKATSLLLARAEAYGVASQDVHKHFASDLPVHPVCHTTTSPSQGSEQSPGLILAVAPGLSTAKLERDVARLNRFLAEHTLWPGIHRGYRRIFNHSGGPHVAWNKGGRLYSVGSNSYQGLKRAQRLRMTIDDATVVEIILAESHLTIAHGLLGLPFDRRVNPYDVRELKMRDPGHKTRSRWVAKAWLEATLGASRHISEWPAQVSWEFEEQSGLVLEAMYPIAFVRNAMETKYPFLKRWGKNGICADDLVYLESVIISNTMIELMDKHQIPSYSVHDRIIVPDRHLFEAVRVLKRNFKAICNTTCLIDMNFADCEGDEELGTQDEVADDVFAASKDKTMNIYS